MTADFEICAAVEIAASAANDRQTAEHGGRAVGAKRLSTARHIIGRFLELAPDDATVMELRERLDDEMPTQFLEAD